MVHKQKQLLCVLVILLCLLVSGCFSREEDISNFDDVIFEDVTEDVHLRIYLGSDLFTYGIEGIMAQYLKEILPEIEYTFFQESGTSSGDHSSLDLVEKKILAEMMESEDGPPDIIIDYTHQIPFLLEQGIISDNMDELARLSGLDVGSFEEAFIEQLRLQQKGELYALPLVRSLHAIRYYPEFLAELEQDFPSHPMTWEELKEWLSSLLQEEEEEHFISLMIEPRLLVAQQRESIVNPDTKEVLANRQIWLDTISLYQTIYPSRPLSPGDRASSLNVTWLLPLYFTGDREAWDLLPFPTFADHPGIGPDYVSDIIAPSAHTDHLEEAMQVIELLVSEEFQTELSRIGLGSPLASPAVHEQFGARTMEYQGKNVQAFFQHRPVATSLFSEPELQAAGIIYPYLVNIFEGMDMEIQLDMMLEELERTLFDRGH